jgi:subtilisin family serine protease
MSPIRRRRNPALGLPAAAVFVALLVTSAAAADPPPDADWRAKADPWVLTALASGDAEMLVVLEEQADLSGAAARRGKEAKGRFVVDRLRETAERSQKPLVQWLAARGIAHRPFWIVNMIWVRASAADAAAIAARPEVARLSANPSVAMERPVKPDPLEALPKSPDAVEWGVLQINADDVWAAGFTGQGIVVAGQDTGYRWTHDALKAKYRGWNGTSAGHDYNWHDAIHSGGGSCGPNVPSPCDDNGHGTHTMGTMVGDDGASNQVGVAPGAKWIGCRNMDQGAGTPTTYAECFQWFLAPTTIAGTNPDPTKSPHVINNSWSCPISEGCTDPNVLKTVVDNTRAAGIVVVVSAGNSGSACSTVNTPAAIYESSFSIGATDAADNIAGFSSRGPVTVDGSNRLKPNVSAPGVTVRSSTRTTDSSYGNSSGTSMAGPHVAGGVALLLSAFSSLEGEVDDIETAIEQSAVPRTTTQTCGGIPAGDVPNNTYGFGRLDVLAAGGALATCATSAPLITAPGSAAPGTAGLTASVPAALGHTFTWTLSGGTITGGQGTREVTFTAGAAGTRMILGVSDDVPGKGCTPQTASTAIQVHFLDVPFGHPYHVWVNTLGRNAVTGGCGGGNYCPDDPVLREQMAVFLLRSKDGEAYLPPACVTPSFPDVPCASPYAAWVNELLVRAITSGCGGGNYCPSGFVSREQMAVFLLRTFEGSAYIPPGCTAPPFADVPCSSPYAIWIQELAVRGITVGCGGGNYCPLQAVSRGEMAVFLVAMFGLV